VVLFKVNLLYFRLRTTRYARALTELTPKDTLHCIEHFYMYRFGSKTVAAHECARPCNCVIFLRIPSACLATRRYEDALSMRITQSISLSNIRTLLSKAHPEALSETCRSGPCGPRSLFPDRCRLDSTSSNSAAIRKQSMSYWWS